MTTPNPIRPLDLVRLRHTPSYTAVVRYVELVAGEALVTEQVPSTGGMGSWLPLDLLELVPGQIEVLVA